MSSAAVARRKASRALAPWWPVAVPYALAHGLQPYAGESLPSFLVRIGNAYKIAQPMRVIKQLWPSTAAMTLLASTDPASEFGEALAEYLDIGVEALAAMAVGTGDPNTRSILGCRMSTGIVSIVHRKYCPECLRKAPFHRAIWDLALLSVCPEHGVRLLDRCPKCERKVSWRTDSITFCRSRKCRADLTTAKVTKVQNGELDGARAILEIVHGRVPSGAAAMTPGDLLLATYKLGIIACGYSRLLSPKILVERHGDNAHLVLQAGWQALADWPHGFHRLMDDLRERGNRPAGRYGVVKVYDKLPLWLAVNGDEPYVAVLADAFARQAAAHVEMSTRAIDVRRYRSADPRGHMTFTEAARRINVSFERMASLAQEYDLYRVAPTGKGAAALMWAHKVQALGDELAALWTKKDVYQFLGISKEAFWTVETEGILTPISNPEGDLRYSKPAVEALLAKLEGSIGRRPKGVRPSDLRSVPEQAQAGPNTGELLRRMLAGEIVPYGLDNDAVGLHRLLVSRTILIRTPGEPMSIVEASGRLGVKQEVAYHWVRIGLLRTVDVLVDCRVARRVPEAALDEFNATYITGVKLAASVGSHSRRWSSQHLTDLGITPVSGPYVDGARQFLFRRADVAKAALRPLRKFVRGEGDAADPNDALALACTVGRDAARRLRAELHQVSSRFVDAEGTTVVQVLTGRRNGISGAYRFVVSPTQIKRLQEARMGYLALAFVGSSWFVLAPWVLAQAVLRWRPTGGADVFINVDSKGRPDALAEFCSDLSRNTA